MLIKPDEIDDRTVPRPAGHVALVEVGDGGILVDAEAGRGYPVNATASLLWKLLDSQSPLGALIDDVSAAFDVSRAEISDSVLASVRVFGELGLLDNVRRAMVSRPIDIEYTDPDECDQPGSAAAGPASFDDRYLAVRANA